MTAPLSLCDYQALAARTLRSDKDGPLSLAILGLGLVGESGEVAEAIKKHVGHGHGLDVAAVKKELGDVLWYVAGVATTLGLDLSEVAAANIDKLKKRYPDGFTTEASLARVDEVIRRFVGVRIGITADDGVVWWSKVLPDGTMDPTPSLRDADIISVEHLSGRIEDELADFCKSDPLTREGALGLLVIRPVYRKAKVKS